ncbi:hypothetical protein BH11ARM2_BH11ARM2_12400 [soil metagenome]
MDDLRSGRRAKFASGCILTLYCLTAESKAQDALVLIRPERAGPHVSEEIDPHPIWVAWGPKADTNGLNRLLEPVTGQSWNVPTRDFTLDILSGKPILRSAQSWKSRGILSARDATLGPDIAVRPLANGAFPPYAAPLAAKPGVIETGEASVMLAEASGWDEVAAIARHHRRTLVLEYPPEDRPYSHLWLFGAGWPTGVPSNGPIPGLLRATGVGALLRHPERARWIESVPRSQSALAWVRARALGFGPLRIAIGLFALFAFFTGLRAVVTERSSAMVRMMVRCALIAPSCAFLAGNLASSIGPELFFPLFAFIILVGGVLERLADRGWAKNTPWLSVSVVALAFLFPIALHESPFAETPGLAVGVYAAALAALLSAGPEPPSLWTWAARAALIITFCGLFHALPPIDHPGLAWLAVACVLTNEGWLAGRRFLTPGLVLIGLMSGFGLNPTFAWEGLLTELSQAGRPNLYDSVRSLLSPLSLTLFCIGLLGAIFLDEYTRHRLHLAFRHEPRLAGLWQFAWLSLPLLTLAPALSMAPWVLIASASSITLLTMLQER